MANPEHLKILKQGVKAWNLWRKDNPGIRPDLSEADLRKRDLSAANLEEANLGYANLNEAILKGASLTKANLGGCSLRYANLTRANLANATLLTDFEGCKLLHASLKRATVIETHFTRANLKNADLSKAVMTRATFHLTNLDGADFTNTSILSTVFASVDLSTTKGLAEVIHMAPSSIATDTLYLSQGRIPESFLRGCGLPDEMIKFARSIASNPAPYHSCFISHSTRDEEFAQTLYTDLQANGVRCWFAAHDVKAGKKLYEQIDHAIRVYDRTLLILSPESIHSPWVKTEIAKARKREVEEKRQILFPIRLVDFDTLRKWECFDADTGTDSAKEIREYFIPDFSNWKDHDSYQEAFKRLLEDLRGERARAISVSS